MTSTTSPRATPSSAATSPTTSPPSACILNIGCSRFCPGEGDNAADRACTDIDIDGDGEIDKL
jgi:hypothetical protein